MHKHASCCSYTIRRRRARHLQVPPSAARRGRCVRGLHKLISSGVCAWHCKQRLSTTAGKRCVWLACHQHCAAGVIQNQPHGGSGFLGARRQPGAEMHPRACRAAQERLDAAPQNVHHCIVLVCVHARNMRGARIRWADGWVCPPVLANQRAPARGRGDTAGRGPRRKSPLAHQLRNGEGRTSKACRCVYNSRDRSGARHLCAHARRRNTCARARQGGRITV